MIRPSMEPFRRFRALYHIRHVFRWVSLFATTARDRLDSGTSGGGVGAGRQKGPFCPEGCCENCEPEDCSMIDAEWSVSVARDRFTMVMKERMKARVILTNVVK